MASFINILSPIEPCHNWIDLGFLIFRGSSPPKSGQTHRMNFDLLLPDLDPGPSSSKAERVSLRSRAPELDHRGSRTSLGPINPFFDQSAAANPSVDPFKTPSNTGSANWDLYSIDAVSGWFLPKLEHFLARPKQGVWTLGQDRQGLLRPR